MNGLQTLHCLNNAADYQLSKQEIEAIQQNAMFPASMAPEANLICWPDPIPAAERVRLWAALRIAMQGK